jgi:hypothetical protein
MSHGSFLARASHAESTSPTRRGAFVQDSLLCNPVPPPPPDVNPTFPDDGVPKTAKQKLEQHMKEESCASCHKQMDPIGFALENFDAIGALTSSASRSTRRARSPTSARSTARPSSRPS